MIMYKMSLYLKDAIDATYLDNEKAANKLMYNGYILDKDLSTANSKTYHNPNDNLRIRLYILAILKYFRLVSKFQADK